MRISWTICRRALARVWFIGAGVLFAILLAQTFGDRYGANANAAWEWFLPTVLPTLSLIIGVLTVDALKQHAKLQTVDRFFFRLSLGLSVAYLLTVGVTLLAQPFTSFPALELMAQSNLWLGPFQGLVTASLGVFFVGGKTGDSEPEA